MAMVELKNIRKKLGGVDILNGVDLSVEEGEVVVILGPSGSGKTTLLRTINFLAPADQGTITIDGLTVDSQKHHHKETLALRRKTGMVFQNYNLFRNKTVIQNITEGLTTVRKIPHEQAVETAMALLKKVNLENSSAVTCDGAENIFHVRLKFLGIHRIPKEDHKVDPIIFNLGSHLLDPAQMTCQIPVDVEIGDLFDQLCET